MKKRRGQVTLAGAGPGDEGLLTLNGKKALMSADVIVYDNLVNSEILKHASFDAEKIYMGKKPGSHSASQDEINALLLKKAKEGKDVVRLKGGDPFVFGRGMEEMEYLLSKGIPCQAVPGIPAAVALSSYTAIPLTDRRVNTMVHIVTGHTNPETPSPEVDWKLLAKSKGVIVMYMGIKNLKKHTEQLIQEGYNPHTPAAVVKNISCPDQKIITGTAATIAGSVESSGITPPALVILGETVNFNEILKRVPESLNRKRIVITRPRSQAGVLADLLEGAGAEPLCIPFITITPPEDYADLDRAVMNIHSFTWILFTSPNGVSYFFERFFALGKDCRDLSGIKIGAVGRGTALRLMDKGISADFVPEHYTTASFVDELSEAHSLEKTQILLPRSDIAPRQMADSLEAKGAGVTCCSVYTTVINKVDPEILTQQLESASLITFTSSSTVKSFTASLGEEYLQAMKSSIHAASIGPETSRALRSHGIEPVLEAEEHSIEGLADEIQRYLENN